DPCGVLAHSGERGELVERLWGSAAAGQHLVNLLEQAYRLLDARALDPLGHQRGRRHRDRAAAALELDVRDASVAELHVEGHPVAAERVDALDDPVRILDLAEIPRRAVVVENYLAVQLLQLVHAKISSARSRPTSSRSTSSRLL